MTLRRFFRFPTNLPPPLRSNFIHLLWDIGWWGLYMGTTAAFLAIYAARSGATPFQIGLLSASPALMSMIISLPAGRILKNFRARPASAAAAAIARSLFLVYALLPWLLPPAQQVNAILILSVVIAIPGTFINIGFSQFFMEGVPSEWRGQVVGARNAIMSIVSFGVTMLSGQILTYLPFPYGYQVVFFIGFIGGVMTAYHIWHVYPMPLPDKDFLPLPTANQANGAGARKSALKKLVIGAVERNYIKVIGLLFLFNLSNNMVAPLVPDILVHKLGLTDAWISVGTGTANMLVFSISLFMASLTRRAGNRRITTLGAGLLAFHAFALAAAQDVPVYILASVIGGIATGLLGTAQYNYHLDNVPDQDRSTWLSWNMLLGNAAVLTGALVGPAVAHLTGTPAALVLLGLLRLGFGLAIFKWG
jgi:MFS family permease